MLYGRFIGRSFLFMFLAMNWMVLQCRMLPHHKVKATWSLAMDWVECMKLGSS